MVGRFVGRGCMRGEMGWGTWDGMWVDVWMVEVEEGGACGEWEGGESTEGWLRHLQADSVINQGQGSGPRVHTTSKWNLKRGAVSRAASHRRCTPTPGWELEKKRDEA